jgi:hypothetical protein
MNDKEQNEKVILESKIELLAKELQVKNALIKNLVHIMSENKVIPPPEIMLTIRKEYL